MAAAVANVNRETLFNSNFWEYAHHAYNDAEKLVLVEKICLAIESPADVAKVLDAVNMLAIGMLAHFALGSERERKEVNELTFAEKFALFDNKANLIGNYSQITDYAQLLIDTLGIRGPALANATLNYEVVALDIMENLVNLPLLADFELARQALEGLCDGSDLRLGGLVENSKPEPEV